MTQTDEDIKKESIEMLVNIDVCDENWKQEITDWWLSKLNTLQEEYKNSYHKVFTRSEWARYQVSLEEKIKEEYKKELIEKIEKEIVADEYYEEAVKHIINIIKQ